MSPCDRRHIHDCTIGADAILPRITHYTIFATPESAETALRFLDEPPAKR